MGDPSEDADAQAAVRGERARQFVEVEFLALTTLYCDL